jgi:hypothetical protein
MVAAEVLTATSPDRQPGEQSAPGLVLYSLCISPPSRPPFRNLKA